MNKNTRKSFRNGKIKGKQAAPSVDSSVESTQLALEPRRSFWKSFSSFFKCSTKRRPLPETDENGSQTVSSMRATNSTDTATCTEDIEDIKSVLKKYSISPNSISMVQRIDDSKDVSKQSSLTGYVTDVSASSSDEEASAKKKVLLKNMINEFKHEIICEECIKRGETEQTAVKKFGQSSSVLTVDKDTYSFDYSESSQQSMADGNEDKAEKVMFDNNIKVKDENDVVTVDSINDASQHSRDNTDESVDEDLDENVNYGNLKHEEKVALIEEQYNIALCTVNKIEEQITAYSKHLENMRSRSSTDDLTEQSLELENRDVMQNAMKLFGTKMMDNQGSNLLRHLHDMHQKHPETIQGNAVSVDEPVAKSKPMNMQLEYRRKFGYEFPHFTAYPSRFEDDEEECLATGTSSSESLSEVEVWSKDLNNVIKYIDRRDLPIFSKFNNCPVNEDGYKMLRLNSLFVAVAHPVTLKYKVVYDPVVRNEDTLLHQYDDASNLVTHKHKYMCLVQPEAMYEEDSMESMDKETSYTNEEKWERCTNESLTQGNGTEVTDEEDSDWKTVDFEEHDGKSLTNTEDSHEEYVNQQNRYNLMCTLPRAATRRTNRPVEFKVTMHNKHPKENLVREYIAYRNDKNLVDRSTSYSSLPAQSGVELLYQNQDAQSDTTSVTARQALSTTFRNINQDVEHMINDLLIDVSELKDGCMEITDEQSGDEPMVELKQTDNGVIDKSSRISEALAQTILHEILEDVFYYSEEHVPSEITDNEVLHSEHDTEISELTDHEECEDTLEGQYTYMRKDDRTKVFKNLNEVMQDLADETVMDRGKLSAAMQKESNEYCPAKMEELYMQRVNDEKMRLLQVQNILQHMLEREANKHQNGEVEREAKGTKSVPVYEHNIRRSTSTGKCPNPECVISEGKVLDNSTPAGCNYHRFFNNNFSIKSGFISTPNSTICNTCRHMLGKQCTTDSGLEPDHFSNDSNLLRYAQKQLQNPASRRSHHRIELPKYECISKSGFINTPNSTICNTCRHMLGKECTTDSGLEPDHLSTDSNLLRYAQKQLRNPASRRSDHRIELPKKVLIGKRTKRLMVDKSTGIEDEMTVPKTNCAVEKNQVEQNIEENLWSFEEAMRNLIRVNKKTAKLLQSNFVLPAKPNRPNSTDISVPCCSKLSENAEKATTKLSKSVPEKSLRTNRNLTARDQTLTSKDQSLTRRDQTLTTNDQSLTATDQTLTSKDPSLTNNCQHLSENLEKILTNFSHQFSNCQDKSNEN